MQLIFFRATAATSTPADSLHARRQHIGELRARLDAFARTRLTPADFDPVLDVDSELQLGEVTPQMFQTLRLLEPYGVGNPEPVFTARSAELAAPPRILKDKHIKLKVRAGARKKEDAPNLLPDESQELSATAILATPRCHPGRLRDPCRSEAEPPPQPQINEEPRTENWELLSRSPTTSWAGTWPNASRKLRSWQATPSTSPSPSDTTTIPNTAACNFPCATFKSPALQAQKLRSTPPPQPIP